MGFFNALRNACESNIKAPNGGSFIRSGLNFNAATQITDKITDIISACFS